MPVGIIFLIAYGATLGFIAALLGDTNNARGYMTHVFAGVTAALASGLAVPMAFGFPGMAQDGGITAISVGASSVGAMVILASMMLFIRKRL